MYYESFDYDKNGNKVYIDKNGEVTRYKYDGMNRLTRAWNDNTYTEYEFDSFNNISKEYELYGNSIETRSYYYDNANHLLLQDGKETVQYEYDNAGNLVKKITGIGSNAETAYYSYDGYNRLSGYADEDTVSEYTYNLDGLRESKTVNNIKTRYVYDGANIIGEITEENAYTYTRGTELIGYTSNSGDRLYYVQDGHGNVTALLNEDGTERKTYNYNPYGKEEDTIIYPMGSKTAIMLWRLQVETPHNPFRYCGEYQDLSSGLIYLRNRYYDPSIGRFISEDPAKDGLNWYVYCGNNPILFIDPTGNESYVFYTSGKKSDFSKQANWQKSYLERGGETVIMKTINSVDEFTKAWDSIGLDLNGNAVAVNKVIIYTHSNDRTLILLDGSPTKALSIDGKNSAGKEIGDLSKLSYKNINELQLLSCNAGHLDPYFAGNSNVASVMSKRISGVTYAYDGNVAFGNPSWKLWGEDIGLSSRLSTTQNSFNQITAYYGKSGRKPKGKLTYYNGEYKPYGYWYDTTLTNGG